MRKRPGSTSELKPLAIVLFTIALVPVVSSASASGPSTRGACDSRWSIDGLHLNMPLAEFKRRHPEFIYRVRGTDKHRIRNVGEGLWYQWTADEAENWNYVQARGHRGDAPIVAITLVRDFSGWNVLDLERTIDDLAARWGTPKARHVSLESTKYYENYGAARFKKKWNATVWKEKDCDVMITAIYRRSRDYRDARITRFHLLLTSISIEPTKVDATSPVFRHVNAPFTHVQDRCAKWSLNGLHLNTTLAEVRAAHPKKPWWSDGGGWMVDSGEHVGYGWAEPETRNWGGVYSQTLDDDSRQVAIYLDSSPGESLDAITSAWGEPLEENMPAQMTPLGQVFSGAAFHPRLPVKHARATVWEDEECGVGATVVRGKTRECFLFPAEYTRVWVYSIGRLKELARNVEQEQE